ncbi:MAG: histidinol-phosphate transaminase [Pseudomonadota bacterium]
MSFESIKYLEAVTPYVQGLRTPEVAKRYGLPPERIAKLASAENPLGPPPLAVKAIQDALKDLSLYPHWQAPELRGALAEFQGMDEDQIVVGCGETELMSFIIRAFSEQGEEILFPIPTFPVYEQIARVERRRPASVHMGEDLIIDPEKLLQAVNEKTRVLILTSPNNPLSRTIEVETLRFILDHISPQILVLLDEAYMDFADETGTQVGLLSHYPNLIVLRTFSKIYGLAGLRVGYGMANKEIIEALMKVKPSWNIGGLVAAGASAALKDREHYERTRNMIWEGRAYLVKELSAFSNVSVIMKPQANFLCLRILDPNINSTQVFNRLVEGGVIIKDCSVSYKGLGDRYLRVDVSLRPKMDQFLEELRKVLA